LEELANRTWGGRWSGRSIPQRWGGQSLVNDDRAPPSFCVGFKEVWGVWIPHLRGYRCQRSCGGFWRVRTI